MIRKMFHGSRKGTLIAIMAAMPISLVSAQNPAPSITPAVAVPAPAFSYELGGTRVESGESVSVYTAQATQPVTSPLTRQRLRLLIVTTEGTKAYAKGQTTTSRALEMATGAHKTVAQISALLTGFIQQFLAGQKPGTALGKIGDIRYGGEMTFIAESGDKLRVDILNQGEAPRFSDFSRLDIEQFLTALHPTPPARSPQP